MVFAALHKNWQIVIDVAVKTIDSVGQICYWNVRDYQEVAIATILKPKCC